VPSRRATRRATDRPTDKEIAMYPDDLKYTSEHEWVREPGEAEGSVRVGITDYAQDALGDIVYVSLPEVGETIDSGSTCGELESTKSVSDLYAPVSGEVVARNDALDSTPELVNSDPYAGGWLFEVVPSDRSQLDDLMDADSYEQSLGS
jgi:glycine cleavage system H protein